METLKAHPLPWVGFPHFILSEPTIMHSTLLLLVLLAAPNKPEPAPKLLYSVPLVVAPGFKGKVLLRGLKLDTITRIQSNVRAKLVGKPKKAAGPQGYPAEHVGDSETEIELEVPKNFAADHIELTAIGPKGKSPPFPLTVDRASAIQEKEPNDSFTQAQELRLPATVDAKIERNRDVDVFRFTGQAGDRVRVEVHAARLGSPVDALVTVYDADRRGLDALDDTAGKPDPVMTVTLPRSGTYFLSVIDAHDTGGAFFVYRLVLAKVK
jgi:hypothetical protein